MEYDELATDRPHPSVAGSRIKVHDVVCAVEADPEDSYDYWELTDEQIVQALDYYLLNAGEFPEIESVSNEEIRRTLQERS